MCRTSESLRSYREGGLLDQGGDRGGLQARDNPGTNRLLPREPSQPHKATICVAVGPRSKRFLGEQNGGYRVMLGNAG